MTEPVAALARRKTPVDEAFALAPQHLKKVLGSEDVVDRFLIVALNQVRKVPALAQCNKESILDALVRMARLNLDPSIPNEVFLLPFNSKEKGWEASLIIGYGGLRKLVLRTPQVRDVWATVVCHNDEFIPPKTAIELPTHQLPGRFMPRGRAIGYYAAALLDTGHWRTILMSREEVVAHRDRYSPGAKTNFWADNHPDKAGLTNFDKMAMKTVLRALCSPRSLTLTAEVSEALEAEEVLYQAQMARPTLDTPREVPTMRAPLNIPQLSEELFGPRVVRTTEKQTDWLDELGAILAEEGIEEILPRDVYEACMTAYHEGASNEEGEKLARNAHDILLAAQDAEKPKAAE